MENVTPFPTPERPTAEVEQLGRYRIREVMGRGAMGVVYKAYDPIIDRLVAIKTIRFDVSVDQDERLAFYERFFREAQTAGKLSHPNIVTIHDIGEDRGITYIAMEMIEGVPLQHYLDHPGSLTMLQILEIVREVALGLDYAHRKQIVHRDVKPANIMILNDDRVKITDFGIAKISSSSTLTHHGVFLGSPNYMSPEQVTGKPIDGRSDIFALGTVFYELCTGRKPFQGDHVAATIYNVANLKPPSPRELVPGIPASVNRLVKKAMQKNPSARFATAKEFAGEVDTVLAELGVRRAVPVETAGLIGHPSQRALMEADTMKHWSKARLRRRLYDAVAGAAAASLVLLCVLAALSLGRRDAPASVPIRAATEGSEVRLSSAPLPRFVTEEAAQPPAESAPRAGAAREQEAPDPAIQEKVRRALESAHPYGEENATPAPRAVGASAGAIEERPEHAPLDASRAAPPPAPVEPEPRSVQPAPTPTSEAPGAAASEQGKVDPRSQETREAALLDRYVADLQNQPAYKDRLDAAERLAGLRDDRAVPYLQYSARSDDSVFVRARCRKILKDVFGVDEQ